MSDDERNTALEFPCKFPIKAVGHHTENFDSLIVSIVRRHAEDIHEGAVKSRLSSSGKYISLTVTITATSQSQLDAIYRELSACERVLMAL